MNEKFYCQVDRQCFEEIVKFALKAMNITTKDPEPWTCKGHDTPSQSMSAEAIKQLRENRNDKK